MGDSDLILEARLKTQADLGLLRSLETAAPPIDFASNDYLGLARNSRFEKRLFDAVASRPSSLLGSTGSRLLTGNSTCIEAVEQKISQNQQQQSATLFPSGYLANLCLFSCIPQRGDTVLVDADIHRSIHDGCQLNTAKKWKFKHNDLADLERLLSRAHGQCFVAVESVYSMDGSFAPLRELLSLCKRYRALLIVDEAHAFGVFGWGLVAELQLQSQVFATVVTYGKALGCHGAAVLGSRLLRRYIVNFGSPLIYSTAASDVQWLAIEQGYDFLAQNPDLSIQLQQNIRFYLQLQQRPSTGLLSPIQPLIISGNAAVQKKAGELAEAGFSVLPIRSPTVAVGQERLRICLHSYNTPAEMTQLHSLLTHKNQHENS
ncbi:aminotransferase class I/II-fold pyridoxal phosphate-dependent enzyme [Flavobacterium sp. JP2137]|uniref:aminotransferase class I/II-fold pyridoxal phosphate-dependent enzyme n=1 Tax=Flavobacterium sp. JP2137 TaxID=3414510 RepID=UPI003D3007A6